MIMFHFKQIVFLVIVFDCCFGLVDIEKYFKICDRNSPDVNDCLIEAISDGITTMINGIEELGVPPIDPYNQDEIRVEYKNNQIQAKMVMKDIDVYGLKASKVHDVRLKADDDRFHLEIDMTTPEVYVKGRYKGEGRYNSLKIDAYGMFNTTMKDLVFTWKLDGTPEQKEEETFMKITSFYMRPDVGDLKSHLTNDNPESKAITDFANQFTNQNWRPLYREMLPYAQMNWNKIGTRVANKIFLKVPYNVLIPAKS